MIKFKTAAIAFSCWAMILGGAAWSADAPKPAGDATAQSQPAELARLKAQLDQQQKQIEELRKTLEAQTRLLLKASSAASVSALMAPAEPVRRSASLGEVASTSPMVPPEPAPMPVPSSALGAPASESSANESGPLSFHVGDAYFTPVGFMDFTSYFRSTTGGTGIGTNFAAIPYGNTALGNLTEQGFSGQNSRLGMRVDANVKGSHVIGYWESDFLGATPGNITVSSNSSTLRMRLYWVDVRKGRWEMLGGQSWSLLTPGRSGISPLPSDVFNSQDMDTNYQVGLTWARTPQFRVVYHPADTVAWGLSLESPQQYIGGSAGGPTVTLPTNLSSAYSSELNTGGNNYGVPNVHPDIISKLAFDPMVGGLHEHIEVVGMLRTFKVYNPLTSQSFSAEGGGASANFNLELVKNFHAIVNTFYSDGGGRYLFGQGPDLIVRGDGSVSLVHASSAIGGFEYNAAPNTLLYAYYGGDYFGRNSAMDPANGKLVGYGYSGSSNSQNRTIQEATFGLVQTFWKNPKYGALQFIGQYSYLTRNPWYAGTGPANASTNMVFLDLRYSLPGSAPKM